MIPNAERESCPCVVLLALTTRDGVLKTTTIATDYVSLSLNLFRLQVEVDKEARKSRICSASGGEEERGRGIVEDYSAHEEERNIFSNNEISSLANRKVIFN